MDRCRVAVHQIDLRTGRSAVAVDAGNAPADAAGRLPSTGLTPWLGAIGVGDGAIWFVAPAAAPAPGLDPRHPQPSGVLQRIDIADLRPTTVRAIPRLPADLAVDEHGAWVLDRMEHTLIGVQP